MDCFKKVGVFDEALKYAQDYDLWMRIFKYYDVRLLKRPLVRYRWHGENLTRVPTQETERERAKLLVRANQAVSLPEIFPSLMLLNETDYPGKFAWAYHQLADFLKKSGLKELASQSEGYEKKARELEGALLSGGRLASFERGSSIRPEVHLQSRKTSGRMTILMQTRSLDKGGLEEVIYNIANHLHQDLFNLVIVCIDQGGATAERCRKLGIPVEVLGEEKEREYQEILSRYEIDLLVTHYSNFGLEMASGANIPIICFLHNIYCWMPDEVMSEMKRADRMIGGYIAVSEDVKTYSVHRFNIPPEKVRVIPNGIDSDRPASKGRLSNVTRAMMGFSESDYLFLHVASFTPAKDHLLLLSAFKGIAEEYPESRLLCVGDVLDKEYHQFILSKAGEYGLENQVRLLDFAAEMAPYYEMADAFVLPSLIEGWSLSMMEAMSYGLPLILTRIGGADQVIENNDIGILVDARYPEVSDIAVSALSNYREESRPNLSSLQTAMVRFLREREFWKKAGLGGKRKVRERLDIRLIMECYERVFISGITLRSQLIRSELVEQRDLLFQEKERILAENAGILAERAGILSEKEKLHAEQERILKVQEELSQKLSKAIQERGSEIQELRHLVEARYQQLDNKVEHVLLRLSIKERIKERLFKSLKASHKMVPKKWREKYQFQYRRLFFDRVFPDKERLENQALPQPSASNVMTPEAVERFLASCVNGRSEHLLVVYTTDPYLESRGQRSTWLTREFVRRGIPVVFFYWRWDSKEAIVESGDPGVLEVPIDEFTKVERQLFSSSLNRLKRIFLVEFPDARLFEKINLANAHSFITVYDCVDDWEEFARAGQAIWYDPAIERYLVRNANLVTATHPHLAEKLKRMGASSVPVIPNGVDLSSFGPGAGEISLQKGALTVGYFGHLTESWFDWDLITKTAQARKDWVFHIIGYGEPSGLKLPENVHFWGRVEHRDLPAYARFWDVALIPFKEGRLTEAVDPIKLYEYLHLGLPVVATHMVHLREIPGVFPCLRDEFESTLILAKQTPFPRQEVERFIQSNTWEKRVDQILEEIGRVDLSGDILKGIR